jgi:hypothetical protein
MIQKRGRKGYLFLKNPNCGMIANTPIVAKNRTSLPVNESKGISGMK